MKNSSKYVVSSSLKSSREKARKKFGLYAQTLSSRVGDKWVTQLLPHNDPIHYGFSIGGAEFKTTPNRTLEKAKESLRKSNNNKSCEETKKEEVEKPTTKTISEVTEEALEQAGLMDEFALPTGKDTKNNNK